MAVAVPVQAERGAGVSAARSSLGLRRLTQLPRNLSHHAEQKLGVVGLEVEAENQVPGFLLEHFVGSGLDVPADAERFEQKFGDLPGLSRGREFGYFFEASVGRGARQLV